MALVYLDSSIVIYLVQRHPVYAGIIDQALALESVVTATSPLVRLEVLVKPMQSAGHGLVELFHQFMNTTRNLSINDATFDQALELRARHHLKTPDALHLAVARQYQCDQFWTNDNRLRDAAGELSVNILSP